MNKNDFFRLYSNCILVEGASFDAVYDLHRHRHLSLPKSVTGLIQDLSADRSIYNVMQESYSGEEREVVIKYVQYFLENDFGFVTQEPHSFPALDLSFHRPCQLEYAIVLIEDLGRLDYEDIVMQLIEQGCKHIQLILLQKQDFNALQSLAAVFRESPVMTVDLILAKPFYALESMIALLEQEPRMAIQAFSCQHTSEVQSNLILHEKDLNLFQKQVYAEDDFQINLENFTEAQHFNIGLNAKVSIDLDGSLKNYFTHSQSFGNVKDSSIAELLERDDLKEAWHLSNDSIEKCKDCQFRYMCYSNSEVVERTGKYYKVDDCHYNPYTHEWSDLALVGQD